MKTTTDEVKKMLLTGRHITKLDLFNESEVHSSCLPQRIYDIRKSDGWNIQWRSVKGKGTLREYWLEEDEIRRIKNGSSAEQNTTDEQQIKESEYVRQGKQKVHENAEFEQLGLGLLGGRNY